MNSIIVNGARYTLTRDAARTNRRFPGSFHDGGRRYIDEWSATAIDGAGQRVRIVWQFEQTAGSEPEDNELPWAVAHSILAID